MKPGLTRGALAVAGLVRAEVEVGNEQEMEMMSAKSREGNLIIIPRPRSRLYSLLLRTRIRLRRSAPNCGSGVGSQETKQRIHDFSPLDPDLNPSRFDPA